MKKKNVRARHRTTHTLPEHPPGPFRVARSAFLPPIQFSTTAVRTVYHTNDLKQAAVRVKRYAFTKCTPRSEAKTTRRESGQVFASYAVRVLLEMS